LGGITLTTSSGAIEPQFYAEFLAGLGLLKLDLPSQHDRDSWPVLYRLFARTIGTKTRDEWQQIFDKRPNSCVTPVLEIEEAMRHPHHIARGGILRSDGAPHCAPRFSRIEPSPEPSRDLSPGRHTTEILKEVLSLKSKL
jgi:alpha-methylacyl-CoA racemase